MIKIKLRGGWARAGETFVDAGQVAEVEDEVGQEMVDGGFADLVDDGAEGDAKPAAKKVTKKAKGE